jgi:purine nucleosidase
MTDAAQAPEAVWLLRKTLAAQPDGSVVVIQVGYSTNDAAVGRSRGHNA